MKNITLSVLVVAVAIGGLVGAVTATLIASSDQPTGEHGFRAEAPSELPPELAEQLASLEQQNRDLLHRMAALERRPVEKARFGDKAPVTKKDLDALAKEVESRIEEQGVAPVPDALKTQVADTLQVIRKEERDARALKATERQRAKMESSLGRMRQKLNLNDRQVTDLRVEFLARDERNRELKRVWEEGGTPDAVIGQTKRRNYEMHQEALVRILTPAQLETHQTSRRGRGKD
ncbi:MAG: hypothetical protein CMJ83_15925 [Planctomycetes bacterium]|nr:hypothetical protein [Planctomycetota bacterium]